jgi:hypothetical protein
MQVQDIGNTFGRRRGKKSDHERFVAKGLEGMVGESRRPRSSPKRLDEEEVCEMMRLNSETEVSAPDQAPYN